MKIINIILLFSFLLFNGCKAQKNITRKEEYRVIDTKDETDIVIVDITNGSLLPFYLFFQYGIEEGTHFADLSPQSMSMMDLEYRNNKYFLFYNDDGDMEIDCKCPMLNNYYIKNLKFKEGNYTLEFNSNNKIKGVDIKVSDKIQNILFQKVRPYKYNAPHENLYFKDLDFMVIDMADTLNVKLTKEK